MLCKKPTLKSTLVPALVGGLLRCNLSKFGWSVDQWPLQLAPSQIIPTGLGLCKGNAEQVQT